MVKKKPTGGAIQVKRGSKVWWKTYLCRIHSVKEARRITATKKVPKFEKDLVRHRRTVSFRDKKYIPIFSND